MASLLLPTKGTKKLLALPVFMRIITPLPHPLNIVVTAQVKSIKCFPGGRIYMSL